MDQKYLAEIRARLDAGRIPMKSDMEALLAEVERMTAENATLKKALELASENISLHDTSAEQMTATKIYNRFIQLAELAHNPDEVTHGETTEVEDCGSD